MTKRKRERLAYLLRLCADATSVKDAALAIGARHSTAVIACRAIDETCLSEWRWADRLVTGETWIEICLEAALRVEEGWTPK